MVSVVLLEKAMALMGRAEDLAAIRAVRALGGSQLVGARGIMGMRWCRESRCAQLRSHGNADIQAFFLVGTAAWLKRTCTVTDLRLCVRSGVYVT
jgi:hypothetical protein